jgi:phage-related protein
MVIHRFQTSGGKDIIAEYLDGLPNRDMVKGYSTLAEVEENGLGRVATRHLRDDIWEIKFGGHRYIYASEGNEIWILHACKKQKNRIEDKDLALAQERWKRVKTERL